MAVYRDLDMLEHALNSEAFDAEYDPDDGVDHSGIYRCIGCGREIVAEEARKFPPQNHHVHTVRQGRVRWKMIVYAVHAPQ